MSAVDQRVAVLERQVGELIKLVNLLDVEAEEVEDRVYAHDRGLIALKDAVQVAYRGMWTRETLEHDLKDNDHTTYATFVWQRLLECGQQPPDRWRSPWYGAYEPPRRRGPLYGSLQAVRDIARANGLNPSGWPRVHLVQFLRHGHVKLDRRDAVA